jgi:4-amino-4-deoxy-L-arabinose transferase-like glycosyltransferase
MRRGHIGVWSTRRTVVAFAAVVVGLRGLLATRVGYGHWHGWNEGHYSLLARGFFDHPLVPQYGEQFVYNVPPLYPYSVALSFGLFGESELAARLPSLLAAGATVVLTWRLGRLVYDDRRGMIAAVLLAVVPVFQLYAGRAQTDLLMTALATLCLVLLVRGYRADTGALPLLVGGGVAFAAAVTAKQPALFVPAVVLAWSVGHRRLDARGRRRTAVVIGASLLAGVPLAVWLLVNYLQNPVVFVATWQKELFGRTTPFASVGRTLLFGTVVGLGPGLLTAATVSVGRELRAAGAAFRNSRRLPLSVPVWWVVFYGAFALYRTPPSHQYYYVTLAPALALLAADGVQTAVGWFDERDLPVSETVLVVVLVCAGVAGTAVQFEFAGEFSVEEGGGTRAEETAAAVVRAGPTADATVLVVGEEVFRPQVMWYLRGTVPPDRVGHLDAANVTRDHLRQRRAESDGPVYLLRLAEEPVAEPAALPTPVGRSQSFNYTVLRVVGDRVGDVGPLPLSRYTTPRQIVVYRLGHSGGVSETVSASETDSVSSVSRKYGREANTRWTVQTAPSTEITASRVT